MSTKRTAGNDPLEKTETAIEKYVEQECALRGLIEELRDRVDAFSAETISRGEPGSRVNDLVRVSDDLRNILEYFT